MREIILLLFLFSISSMDLYGASIAQLELKYKYEFACSQPSDINEHVPVLCSLATECSSVVEIGLNSMVSSWGILKGLSENPLNS